MGIRVKGLGRSQSSVSSRGCVGCGPGSRSGQKLGDPVMMLEGGLGITDLFRTASTEIPTSEPSFDITKVITQQQQIFRTSDFTTTATPLPPPPEPTVSEPPPGGTFQPTTFAPTDAPLPPPPPVAPPTALPPAQEPPADDGKTVKVALAVGGTLVLAAFLLRGR